MDNRFGFHEALSQKSFNTENMVMTLFDTLKSPETGLVEVKKIFNMMASSGIETDDIRLSHLMKRINELVNKDETEKNCIMSNNISLNKDQFEYVAHENLTMLMKIATNEFCIPQFAIFSDQIKDIFNQCKVFNEGANANYIPELKEVNEDLWGCSVCTVDGQRLSFGDSSVNFTIQSTSKPITYALAITEYGSDYVHKYVGYEPSGHKFNMVILNDEKKPHNPLINSGAIVVVSLLEKGGIMAKRFSHIQSQFNKMAGGISLSFNNAVYLSERESADRNFSLAYFMREHKCYPPNSNLNDTLDLYFQLCSIEGNCKSLSVIAACLANGGVNPLTGERILSSAAVRDTLSVMHSCGMYDYSGQFAFKVGLPAKSGVSGVIMLVVPNLMGIALYSPRVDSNGNSVKGIEFCKKLVERFVFHNYDSQLHSVGKMDPRKVINANKLESVVRLLFAAQNNDVVELRRCLIHDLDVSTKDYDDRTGLHVAASSGSLEAVKFFVEVARVDLDLKDRWNRTALDNAIEFGHLRVIEYLEKKNARRGKDISSGEDSNKHTSDIVFELEHED